MDGLADPITIYKLKEGHSPPISHIQTLRLQFGDNTDYHLTGPVWHDLLSSSLIKGATNIPEYDQTPI